MFHRRSKSALAAALALLLGVVACRLAAAATMADWVFPACPASPPDADPQRMERLAGSSQQFPRALIFQRADAIDWFPQSHGAMPPVVASGRESGKTACGYCHLPDGAGRPENAKLAGLPQAYIVTQLTQMHDRERLSAVAGYPPFALMRASIENLSDEDIRSAAGYFSRQPPRAFERVVEADRVPAFVAKCFVLVATPGSPQLLGERIVELADSLERFELRDPRTTYTAYVPRGSLGRGARLALRGRDALAPCASCHGADLRGGAGQAGPPLAGRFAGYIARQLYGFKSGARQGASAQPMQAVVASLSEQDLRDVTAYVASLKP